MKKTESRVTEIAENFIQRKVNTGKIHFTFTELYFINVYIEETIKIL